MRGQIRDGTAMDLGFSPVPHLALRALLVGGLFAAASPGAVPPVGDALDPPRLLLTGML
jgi:hypothetical protein